jgi:hypothetical protein
LTVEGAGVWSPFHFHPWRTATRSLEATHLDTSNTVSRSLEEERERKSTRRAGPTGTSDLLHLKRGILRDSKKVISLSRGFSIPRFRIDAPASLLNTATLNRRSPAHAYYIQEALVAQKELSSTRWIRRHQRGVGIAVPVCRPQHRPKIAASPSLLLSMAPPWTG